MTPYVVTTAGLTKTYQDVVAVDSLDLQVPKNSIFGFLGPNGAGKTTTMKLLLGLMKPTSGSASVFDLDIVRDSVEIRTRVGYLSQEPRFYEYMTAREALTFTARFFFRGPDAEIERRVDEMLDLVDLSEKAGRPVSTFSGGERQRLGIAQAQVNYPDLLILDEPAASLDPLGRRDVLDVMSRLRKHTTVFYSTHILDDVQRVSDAVAILNHGKLVYAGAIETLLTGSGGVVYVVAFRGNKESARERLTAQSYVAGVEDISTGAIADCAAHWRVAVTDQKVAEARLLRTLLADDDVVVTEFRRQTYELEDVFVQLVEGGSHGG